MSILFSRPKNSVREPKTGWQPRLWASLIPFRRPGNYLEVFRALWENRDNLRYALRILNHGVCDGCALGTAGLKDWTIEGVHLCNVRLRLLRLNTMPPLEMTRLADVAALKAMRSRDLHRLGRLSSPMIRRRGEAGFRPIEWDEALALITEKIRATQPERTYFYLTSRGIPNETYYAVQKAVRAMGTNNIDNAARVCHSPSTFALKAALGVAATTCSYSDLIGTDLITFLGSNVASNQPVIMKYLYHAKKAGTQVVTVNPYREPGMDAYWIPSDIESGMFGTRITDHFFQVQAGGDMAFLYGVARVLIEQGRYDYRFIENHTAGFEELKAYLSSLSWEQLEQAAGITVDAMEAYARLLAQAERAVFVWGMGITQHTCGEDNVHAIINLALLRGFVGREGCGLMPIRGHSGVQGGAEMGAYATALPGGLPLTPENVARLSEHYGFAVPEEPGITTPEMIEAALAGKLDVLFAIGGNFQEVLPNPGGITAALEHVPLRVHLDITLSSQMFIEPGETVILLPAMTRYEIPGGITETSTERRIIFSPEIPGTRIPAARSEWDVLGDIAARVRPELADRVRFASTQAIRDEIAQLIPFYDGIQHLKFEGDQFQYGGSRLCQGWNFPTPTGKAHFRAARLPVVELKENEFIVATRRGKQFNSLVHEETDSANRLKRDAIIINRSEAQQRGFTEGEIVQLANEHGVFQGKLAFEDIAARTLQVYWPEGNVLVAPGERSPLAKIPAYKFARAVLSRPSVSPESRV